MKMCLSTPAFFRAVVIVQIVAFLASVYYCLYPFPFLDQVDWILSYLREGIGSVFALHNEHRLPIPRLLLVLDLEWFRGNSVLVPLAGLGALAVLARLLVLAMRKHLVDAGPPSVTIFGYLALLLLIRGFTLPDYVTPSIIQFVLCLAFSALSLSAATKNASQGQNITAMAYGVMASGCGANGLAVFPVLAWISWRLWKNWRRVFFLSMIAVVWPLVYFHGLNLGSSPTFHPWQSLKFFIEYFGVPWERLPMTYPLALLQGAFTVGVLTFFIVRRTFIGMPSPAEVFLLALAGVLLATGLMTAMGRSSSVDLQTQGSRYALMAATAQAVMLILLARPLGRFMTGRHLRPLYTNLAIVAFSVCLLTEQGLATLAVHQRMQEIAEAKEHVCSGDLSPKYLDKIYLPDTRRALDFVETVRARTLYCGT